MMISVIGMLSIKCIYHADFTECCTFLGHITSDKLIKLSAHIVR